MQNPNIPNAGHLTNRSQAAMFESLQSRSLSPNIQLKQNYNEEYPNDIPMQQYYHSMPHVII